LITDAASTAYQRGRALIPATLLILSCAGTHSTRRGDRVVVSSYPQPIQEAYRVFAIRCSRCHTLARPLNAHITDPQHWVRYVTRMRRQPTSGINREDAEAILRFLLFYAREQVAAEKADHEKTSGVDGDLPAPTATPAPGSVQAPRTSEAPRMPADTPDGGQP
jgi:hypothetical protein